MNQAILWPVYLSVIGAVLGWLIPRKKPAAFIANLLTAFASLAICIVAYRGFFSELHCGLRLFNAGAPLNLLNSVIFHVDKLSAVFLAIIGVLGFCASIYGLSYLGHYDEEKLALYAFHYPLFILSMYLVVVSWNLIWFIVFWELMTLFSQFLVVCERSERAIKAGYKYFCMTKAGADFLLLAVVFVTLKAAGLHADYGLLSKLLPVYFAEHEGAFAAITIALLIGACVKAAVVPLHSWLPDAHPEAPSNVSALLSGVMIKMPIYLMFRFFLTFAPVSATVGLLIMVLAALTLLFGVMYALIQTDSKRLLAFSSVEQIGYITLGLGAGMWLIAMGHESLGAIALVAALFHTANHALYKGLLFLVAGSVLFRTGTRLLDRLGRLFSKMPLTAVAALVGTLSIAGIPPLNGFVSKWMLYSTTLMQPQTSLFGAIALVVSALTAAVFVKFFTTIFTQPPEKELDVKEVPFTMWVPQMLLALLCIIFGIFPFLPLRPLISTVNSLGIALSRSDLSVYPGVVIPGTANLAPIVVIALIFIITLVLAIAIGKVQAKPVWTCGNRDKLNLRLAANAYYQRFRKEFGFIYEFGTAVQKLIEGLWLQVRLICESYERLSYRLNAMLTGAVIILLLIVILLGGKAL